MAGRRGPVMPVRWRSIPPLHSVARLKPVPKPRNYKLERTSRALNPTGGFLKGFAYSLNPYIGCAFGAGGGCPFCYVRALPITMKGEGAPWGSWVIAKMNLKERLLVELAAMRKSGRLESATVFMSSATDPYQGLERK